MPGRYSAAQRAQFHENRKQRAAGLKYGYSYQDQGYTGDKESGATAYARADEQKRFGHWGESYDKQVGADGQIYWRPKADQADRIAEAGGRNWTLAPAYAQKSYQQTRGFFNQNPNATWQDYQMNKGLQGQIRKEGMVQDPSTGYWVHQGDQGVQGAYARDQQGRIVDWGAGGYTSMNGLSNWSGSNYRPGQSWGQPQQGQPQQGGGMWNFQDNNQYGNPYQAGGPQTGPQWGSARGGYGWGPQTGTFAQGGGSGGFSNPTQGLSKTKGGW